MSELEVFTQKRYRCPFCRRSWSRRPVAQGHVTDCPRDPERASCLTCTHLAPAEAPEHDTGYAGCPQWCRLGYDFEEPRHVRACPGWNADSATHVRVEATPPQVPDLALEDVPW